jgi:hypothetical protein
MSDKWELNPKLKAFIRELQQKREDRYNAMQQCPALCLIVIRWSDRALRAIPENFWKNQAFCMEAVKSNGEAMDYIPSAFLTPDLFLGAVRENGMALEFIPRMRLTKEIIITAVMSRRSAFSIVPDEWREEAKAALEEK